MMMKLFILVVFALSTVVSQETPRVRIAKDHVGPGKLHTLAPTPTPPTRNHVDCIRNCNENNGGAGQTITQCHAGCPPAPADDIDSMTPHLQASYYTEGNTAAATGDNHSIIMERIGLTPEQKRRQRNARRSVASRKRHTSAPAPAAAVGGDDRNILTERIDITPEEKRQQRNARREQVQTCVSRCAQSGSKTRTQCRTQCTGTNNQRNNDNERSVGPGKFHTLAPTPTPPTRNHVDCIQDCNANIEAGQNRAQCHAGCPPAPLGMATE